MIDVRKLQHWRRMDLEAIIFRGRMNLPGNVAGDIVLGSKRTACFIRFSIEQHDDDYPFVTLSAENHTKCTDAEVHRFFRFAGLKMAGEVVTGATNFARSFRLKP